MRASTRCGRQLMQDVHIKHQDEHSCHSGTFSINEPDGAGYSAYLSLLEEANMLNHITAHGLFGCALN